MNALITQTRHGIATLPRLVLTGFLASAAVRAALIETVNFDTFSGNPALAIPDGTVFGIYDERTVASSITSLDRVEVSLSLSGGFIGDLYVYLRYGDGFSVLLNRPGRSSALPFGYDDAGVSVTFSDDAIGGDFHTYRDTVTPTAGTPLIGSWRPDGLTVLPVGGASAYDTATPTARLNSFQGLNPNGTWTLYAADLSGEISHQIDSWSLILSGVSSVPEPGEITLATALLLTIWSGWRRVRQTLNRFQANASV